MIYEWQIILVTGFTGGFAVGWTINNIRHRFFIRNK